MMKFHLSVQPFSNQILLVNLHKPLGMKMFGLLDHVKTARHRARALAIRGSAEVQAYIPETRINLPAIETLPQGTQARLAEMVELVRARNLDAAAALVEAAYEHPRKISPGFYEFECLVEPLLVLVEGEPTPAKADEAVRLMTDWVKASPDSAIASGCLALACLQAGFAHRGKGWADTIGSEALAKLDEYCERARLELDRTHRQHARHWFWTRADLQLAILDMTNRADHWARFERAIAAAPGSSEIYGLFAHQLMPRWHGDYTQLRKLCEHAFLQEDELTGLHNYAQILTTLLPAEGEAAHILFHPAPLTVLARHYAARPNDGDRTFAVNLYAWADNWTNVLATMKQLETFHSHRWMCINSLEYTVAYALVGLPSDERKRA